MTLSLDMGFTAVLTCHPQMDALTKRAKQGEDAFLNIYERMMRLPGRFHQVRKEYN